MLGTGYKGAAVPGHHATNKKKKGMSRDIQSAR